MEKLILSNFQAPGDVVMLTAAVRDLHLRYPGAFLTDVRTPYPELWEGNPYLTDLADDEPGVREVRCEYPLVHASNRSPCHFLHGFIHDLNQQLGLDVRLTEFRGDMHLGPEDRAWPTCLGALDPHEDFWVVVSGGKHDLTAKWWDPARFQEVVDHFAGGIRFVQVGAAADHHPALTGVVDLRGRTDLRELVRVIHHASGVLTPVSLPMHLAAAVEAAPGRPARRPCVVVAGGREPPHWEAYPQHQFIHTVGALTCCAEGGCWKSRAYPLGDGSEHDQPHRLCTNLAGALPRCMDLITAQEVVRRIELYHQGGVLAYRPLAPRAAPSSTAAAGESDDALTPANARERAARFLDDLPPYPPGMEGRGIVICGGGRRYFPCAWVCIQTLRDLGCTLPVELWYRGPAEMDERIKALVEPLGVTCVDGRAHLRAHGGGPSAWPRLGGFELKAYAVVHSRFREVLSLDADNVPVVNPERLFDTPEYARTGALFWPDFGRLAPSREIWEICGVPYRDEPEFESGQMVVDKARCWPALQLALWYNRHSELFYRYIHGDKDTFHLAFRRVQAPYAMPDVPIHPLDYTMCQHDFQGNRVFQHRNLAKWAFRQPNLRIHDFWLEEECLRHLHALEQKWDGRIDGAPGRGRYDGTPLAPVAGRLAGRIHRYHRVGYDSRLLTLRGDGTVAPGEAENEVYWDLHLDGREPVLEIAGLDAPTCFLKEAGPGVWKGRWLRHERMPVELIPA